MKTLRHRIAGLLVTLAVCIAPAFAQQQSTTPAGWAGSTLRVDGFDIEQVPRLSAGTALNFTLYGSAGATATLRIEGAERGLILGEVQSGVYEGSYTIAPQDHITADSRVVADMRLGDRMTTALLEEPLVLGATPRAAVPPPETARELPRHCPDCGVVEAVNAIEDKGNAGYLGSLAGGVVGAIIGSQFGGGDGRTATGVLGAVGGAYIGREIERASRKRTHYVVVVRLKGGATQTRSYDTQPPFRVGDRVRIAGSALTRDLDADADARVASPY
ncbi:MAG TPA: glycine zipper 2TM domain-containing protein [Albitalea sp.]|jgi:outer membrane lipoprotein SlyB|nr:glycine zipper 2TM domain-containing protein [Albitalea sp.]